MKTPSVEPVLRSRLLPRISFRVMFVLMTFAAIIAAMARAAGSGGQLATATLAAVIFPVACFLLFALLFLVTWAVTMARRPTGWGCVLLAGGLSIVKLVGIDIMVATHIGTILFLFCAGMMLLLTPGAKQKVSSNPFAAGQLPPQILPPREQAT